MGTIAHLLERDHNRVRAMLEGIDGDRLSREQRHAIHCSIRRLRHHFRIEEELVFPAIELALGSGAIQTTHQFVREHLALDVSMTMLELELERPEPVAIGSELRSLRKWLALHETREEAVLYPIAESLLTAVTKIRIVAAIAEEPLA